MSKLVKNLIESELKTRYADTDNAVWIELLGADGLTTTRFRRALREKSMRVEIVKTALFRRAMSGRPLARLAESLEGPAALVTGGESAIQIAKELDRWRAEVKTLKVRGALLEGELIAEARVGDLSKMPGKRELQGRIAGAVRSPGAKLAAAVLAPGSAIAGCLKSIVEKLEKAEPAGAEPQAAAAG